MAQKLKFFYEDKSFGSCNFALLVEDEKDTEYTFMLGKKQEHWEEKIIPENNAPKIPLRGYGELWHLGWGIPTMWAIDKEGQCWASNAHGSIMDRVSDKELISIAEEEGDKNKIRALLGMAETVQCKHCGGTGWNKNV